MHRYFRLARVRAGASVVFAWAGLFGCAPEVELEEQDDVEVSTQALVRATSNPPIGETLTGPLSPLPGTLYNFWFGTAQLGEYLNQAPVRGRANSWADVVTNDPELTPPNLNAQLKSAIKSAQQYRKVRITELEDVYEWLERSSFIDEVLVGEDDPELFGYTSQSARWLDEIRYLTESLPFPDPNTYAEHRERGARLYCAAKTAFEKGGGETHIMGRRSLFGLDILDSRIDILAVEPTVAMAAPTKALKSGNDGAQAFNIPLSVGARFAPLSIMQTTPEIRTPVNLITADGETLTRAETSDIAYQAWQTATHADAFISVLRTDTIKFKSVTLFYIGPVPVVLSPKIKLSSVSCSDAKNLDECKKDRLEKVTRIWGPGASEGAGYPMAREGGFTGGIAAASMYNDNHWVRDGQKARFGFIGRTPLTLDIPEATPLQTRFFQDDDKSVEVRTSAEADLTLYAGLDSDDLDLPEFVEFKVSASGNLNGNASVVHEIREHAFAAKYRVSELDGNRYYDWVGETGLSVTPYTEAGLFGSVRGDLVFKIHVNIPFLGRVTIDLGGKLFAEDLGDEGELATSTGRRWDERNRLRIGTGTSDGAGYGWTRDFSQTHWPTLDESVETGLFRALPQSVPTCLGAAARTGDIDPPCGVVVPTYPPSSPVETYEVDPQRKVRVGVCAFAPVQADALDDCEELEIRPFLRGGGSDSNFAYHRDADGQVSLVWSRMLDPQDASSMASLRDTLGRCLLRGFSAAQIRSRMQVALCDESGRPYEPEDVLEFSRSDATELPPNSCQF